MQRLARAAVSLLALVAFAFGGCGDDPEPGLGFNQPLAGLIVSAGGGSENSGLLVLYALRGDSQTTPLPVPWTGRSKSASDRLTIASLDRTAANPFELLTLKATGVRATDSAISVLFHPAGLPTVAVPAIAATSETIEVAVPPLLDASGAPLSTHVAVQVVQVGPWGHSASAAFDGLDIAALPDLSGTGQPAGTFLDAYLSVVLGQIGAAQGAQGLPDSFLSALGPLASQLGSLQTATRAVMADPAAQPTVDGTAGPSTFPLDAASLALADRLVAGMLASTTRALQPATTGVAPLLRADAPSTADCPNAIGVPSFDEDLCEYHRYAQNQAAAGRRGVALGAKIELSVYFSLFGGVASGVVGAVSQAGTAFELAWTAVSGHLVAWATATERPTAGQTLSEVGVTVLDTLAGTKGLLGAVYSAVGFGKEYDAAIRASAAPATPPAPPTNPTSTAAWAGTWSGTYALTLNDGASGCTFQHRGAMELVLSTDTTGGYRGTFSLSGVQALNSPGCTLNGTHTITEAIGVITVAGDTIQADLVGVALRGTRSGSSLTGTLTPGGDPGSGTFTLTKQ